MGFSVGDRVISCSPGYFATYEYVPDWACCKIHDHEGFSQVASVPTVFATAIYALQSIARLQAGESVLIHSATSGVGLAAIQLTKDIGANIFATIGTDDKVKYLSEKFDLDPTHIFSSRNTSFISSIMRATDNKGVDVVLNSLTGEKLHASLGACAKFGRFIKIGKHNILDAGNLNMRIFERSITFSAFNLHELYYSSSKVLQQRYSRLLHESMALWRKIGAPAPIILDVGEISRAFRLFSNGTCIGKIVVSFENCTSLIPHTPLKFITRFSEHKTYLLVGCLGGLERSIARYMLSQGARHFTFIGRSGEDKVSAKSLVEDLKRSGATVNVVRGDVQDIKSVELAVSQVPFPLSGVVQAVMALAEGLFTSMTHSQWRNVLRLKIQGTWNIHNAIRGKDEQLDFFLMTSSLSGSIVSPTESNYCAANCFLDYFAAYRRSLGLPATSLALGQMSGIGYIHEHAEIEQMLARRGITDLSEDDMLHFIDIVLSSDCREPSSLAQTNAHIVTGLEATRMGNIRDQGYELSLEMFMQDPRFSILAPGILKNQRGQGQASSSDSRLPKAVDDALNSSNNVSLGNAVFRVLAKRLTYLILIPSEKILPQLRLSKIGMDSILTAEYRTFIFRALSVDIPFLVLMDSKSRMSDLISLICKDLA